jgi:predicted GNAT family acetyltransferase
MEMLVKRNHKTEAEHILFAGENIKEQSWNYIVRGKRIAEIVFFQPNENEIYIDLIKVEKGQQGKGFGTKIVGDLKLHFPKVQKFTGFATKEILEGFWAKQQSYQFSGEGSDEQEGYYWFTIKNERLLKKECNTL